MHQVSLGLRVHGRQLGLIASLLTLSAAGWLAIDERMADMDQGPGTDLGSLGFYVTAWVVMMAAMMFPSISPMVAVYAQVQRRRREGARGPEGATPLFVAGYLLMWTAFGVAAYALSAGVRALDVEAMRWEEGGRYVAAGLIVMAAIYQLTPAKDACLSRCRGPLSFVLERWRAGRLGALRMGAEHGAWCVGCCWALMVALFALGVMSVGWMLFTAALIAVEKLLPWKALANRGLAVLLLLLGLAMAAAPEQIPGLTLPSEHGGGSMELMEPHGR